MQVFGKTDEKSKIKEDLGSCAHNIGELNLKSPAEDQ